MAATASKKSRVRAESGEDEAPQTIGTASTEPQDHPFASLIDPWLRQSEMKWVQERNTNALTESSTATFNGAMGLFHETGRFFSERLKKDMETYRALSECKTHEDYYRVQADFFDQTLRDYADEMARFIHLAADFTQTAYKPLEDRTKEALHSVAAIPKENGNFA